MLITIVFGIVAVAGAAVYLGLISLLHVLPTGYGPVRNAVSDYGVGRYRFIYGTALVAMAIAAFALAIAISSAGGIRPEPASVIGFLVASGVARILISVFPTDLEGRPPTSTGRIHVVFAIVVFASVAFAAGYFKGTAVDTILGWIVVVMAIATGIGLATSRLKPVFGLVERSFCLSMACWFLVIGIELVRLSL